MCAVGCPRSKMSCVLQLAQCSTPASETACARVTNLMIAFPIAGLGWVSFRTRACTTSSRCVHARHACVCVRVCECACACACRGGRMARALSMNVHFNASDDLWACTERPAAFVARTRWAHRISPCAACSPAASIACIRAYTESSKVSMPRFCGEVRAHNFRVDLTLLKWWWPSSSPPLYAALELCFS